MKYYTYKGKTYTNDIPDPLDGVSPLHLKDGSVNEARFKSMGGTITDDGEPSPEERVCASFAALIADLAKKTDKISPAEFLAAARNGISSDLIAFARERNVPEEVIAEGRARIVEIMADALRYGITWDKLIHGVIPK